MMSSLQEGSATRLASVPTEVNRTSHSPSHPCANDILVSYEEFKKATETELGPMRVHEGTMGMSIRRGKHLLN